MLISNNFSKLYSEGQAVFLQPACRRIVRLELWADDDRGYYDENDDEYGKSADYFGNYFLSFPDMLFSVMYRIKSKAVFFRELLCAFTDKKHKKLYMCSLPNVSESFDVCMGDFPYNNGYKSIEKLYNVLANRFWSSTFDSSFDSSLGGSYEMYSDKLLGNYNRWQQKTKKDPNWIPSTRSMIPSDYDDYEDFFWGTEYKDADKKYLK
jgi:hypothetical protein